MIFTNNQPLTFCCVSNDSQPSSSMKLIQFKCIIAKALPNMDKPHIIRLLFDHRHQSMIAYEHGKMIGGVCFATFQKKQFCQIAFLAVKADKRIQGYGKKIINKLKSTLQSRKIKYMLTYGDNMALGFFRKQGFSQKITISHTIWDGFIKQYDGGKLMQCKIHPNVDYIHIDQILKKQKNYVIDLIKMNSLNNSKFYSNSIQSDIQFQRKNCDQEIEVFKRDPRTIPGVVASGWSWEEHDLIRFSQIEPLNVRSKRLIDSIKKHPQSKYFLQPVSIKQVPSYYTIITNPMDFRTISQKINSNKYVDEMGICKDIELIFQNCKTFNHPESVYYKSGVKLMELIKSQIQAFKNGVISTNSQNYLNKSETSSIVTQKSSKRN